MILGRRAGIALPALLAAARANASQPATLLVGAPPGGAVDIWARGVAPFLERHWTRATITVVNRPGHGGVSAARALAGAAPDGLTLAAIGTPILLARAVEQGQLGMVESFRYAGTVAEEPIFLVASASSPLQTLDDLRGLPASSLLGTPPPGTAAQLAGSAVALRLGLKTFSFSNAAAVRQAVQAGHVPVAMLTAPDVIGSLREGRIVAMALAGRTRVPQFPDVPTLGEQGVAYNSLACRGFALPRDTPGAIVQALSAALAAIVNDLEFIAQAHTYGYTPRFQGPDEWTAGVRAMSLELVRRWESDPWLQRPG